MDRLRAVTPARRRCGVVKHVVADFAIEPEPPEGAPSPEVLTWVEQVSWQVAIGEAWAMDEWRRVRDRLRRDELVAPTAPEYLVTMIRGVAPVWDELDRDEGLTQDEVWRLFDPEEAVLIALNGNEMYQPDGGWWSLNIARLATLGRLDAARVRSCAETAVMVNPWPAKNRFYKRVLRFMDEARTDLFSA